MTEYNCVITVSSVVHVVGDNNRALHAGASNSAKFRGGGCREPAKIRQRGRGVAIFFYFLYDKNITF